MVSVKSNNLFEALEAGLVDHGRSGCTTITDAHGNTAACSSIGAACSIGAEYRFVSSRQAAMGRLLSTCTAFTSADRAERQPQGLG